MTQKNSTRELLQLINNFSKVAGYKINSSKSVAFLYSNYKQAEQEVREMTPFTIVTNNIKYLGMTLTKQIKDMYDENFWSLKEIEEDLRKWKNLPCSWIGRINIVKMDILPKAMYIAWYNSRSQYRQMWDTTFNLSTPSDGGLHKDIRKRRLTLLCLLALTVRTCVHIFFKILVYTVHQVKQISLID